MTRILDVAPRQAAEIPSINALRDAASESVGRLTVANALLHERLNGHAVPGGWDIAVVTDIIDAVIESLKVASRGEAE